MKSASDDSEDARLAALWDRAREYERRTMSDVAVTDPTTGVKLLQVTPLPATPGRSQVVIRDSHGHDLLKNDTNAGWGLAAPQNGYNPYPTWPAIFAQSTSFVETWLYAGWTYGQAIEYGYIAGTEFTDTFAECRLEYATSLGGSWTTVAGSTHQSNQDVSDIATVFTTFSGTFTLPLTAAGQFFGVRIMCRVASGPGLKAWVSPVYLNQL